MFRAVEEGDTTSCGVPTTEDEARRLPNH